MTVVIECPNCGKNVSNLATKCPHCNKLIERAGGSPEYVKAPPAGGGGLKKLVTLIVVVAVLAAAAYYVLPMFGIKLF